MSEGKTLSQYAEILSLLIQDHPELGKLSAVDIIGVVGSLSCAMSYAAVECGMATESSSGRELAHKLVDISCDAIDFSARGRMN